MAGGVYSKRVCNAKVARFSERARGEVAESVVQAKRDKKVAVGPIMLAFFVFVVIGSALLQVIATAMSPPNI